MYVDVSLGSDSNDGLAPGSGALKTINAGLLSVSANLDLGAAANVTIRCAAGTYPESVQLLAYFARGHQGYTGPVKVTGDPSNISAVVVAPVSGNAVVGVETNGMETLFTKMRFKPAAGSDTIYADLNSWIVLDDVYLDVTAGFFNHLHAAGGIIEVTGNLTVASGDAVTLFYSGTGGKVLFTGGQTVTLLGTPNWTFSGAYATTTGIMSIPLVTFTGAATGVRYTTEQAGGIDTASGGSATYLPGSVNGTATSPGWYK